MDVSLQGIGYGTKQGWGCGNSTPGAPSSSGPAQAQETQATEAIRPGQASSQTTPVINFSTITWDNGREIGINDGRTMYFNGLSRTVNRGNGTITLRPTGWQSFGFDSSGSGSPVQVGSHTHVEVEISDLPSVAGGFLKIELIVGGSTHQLWLRHPDANNVNFQPVAGRSNVFRAQLPAALREATVTKVQFLGELSAEVTLRSVNFVTVQ